MTPDQLVTALLNLLANPYIDIDLRTGLRLEQVTAKLQTVKGLTMDPRDFYELTRPDAGAPADYPWIEIPDGASLEGYLWPATYRVLPDTSAEELVRFMLDRFHDAIGDRMNVPEERGLSWYEVLTLASLVEKEAILEDEKPLIAGVYQNRLDGERASPAPSRPERDLPTTRVELDKLDFDDWQLYAFGTVPEDVALADVELPPELEGYNTYRNDGLPPGPWRPRRCPRSTPSLPTRPTATCTSWPRRRIPGARVREDPRRARGEPAGVRLSMTASPPSWPSPADFAPPPTADDHARWTEADRAARAACLERLRARYEGVAVDAYFGVRRENSRYLTGFVLGDGEEKVAGHSGQFLVSAGEVVVLADFATRSRLAARRPAPGSRMPATTCPERPPGGVRWRAARRGRGGIRAARVVAPAGGGGPGRGAGPGRGLGRG